MFLFVLPTLEQFQFFSPPIFQVIYFFKQSSYECFTLHVIFLLMIAFKLDILLFFILSFRDVALNLLQIIVSFDPTSFCYLNSFASNNQLHQFFILVLLRFIIFNSSLSYINSTIYYILQTFHKSFFSFQIFDSVKLYDDIRVNLTFFLRQFLFYVLIILIVTFTFFHSRYSLKVIHDPQIRFITFYLNNLYFFSFIQLTFQVYCYQIFIFQVPDLIYYILATIMKPFNFQFYFQLLQFFLQLFFELILQFLLVLIQQDFMRAQFTFEIPYFHFSITFFYQIDYHLCVVYSHQDLFIISIFCLILQ